MTSQFHFDDFSGDPRDDGEVPFAAASEATLLALEVPSFLAVFSQFAATDLGRERAIGLVPFDDLEALGGQRAVFEEVGRLLPEGPLVPLVDVPLRELLDRLSTGRPPLLGVDLVRLGDLMRASRSALARIRALENSPALHALAQGVTDLSPLLQRIDKALDRRGEVREDASPKLVALRQQIRRVRDQLYRELSTFVGEHRDDLSEETIPMRGGRLVLMLNSGSRGRTSGLVHGRSATGRSFYFEPLGVVESNNELQSSVEDEEAEKRRIVNELLAAVRKELPALEASAQLVAELDLAQAAHRFAEVAHARLPEISNTSDFRLLAARHPLLDPRLADARREALGQAGHEGNIVPLDLALSPAQRILIVTGPNAGGKTVALKTAGLLSYVALCGLPIPAAAGSRVPFLEKLVASVGDEQDLLADRSTFSGRLLRLREAWDAAGPATLLLLDELGSGTDPAEGAALSIALVEELARRGSLAIVTTHLAQLAAAALEMDGASCAAMEFEPKSGQPTFRLLPGPPGGSEAIALARRLGLPAEWLDRAESRLGTEHRDLRRLLGELERTRGDLAEAHARLEMEAQDAETLRRRLAAELVAAQEERKQVGKKLQRELEEFRQETARKLRTEVDRLRERFEQGKRRGLEAEAVERLFEEAPVLVPAAEATSGPISVGGAVRHRSLGWEGVLERLEGERAEVLVRGKRVRCRAEELLGSAGVEKPEKSASERAPISTSRRTAGRSLDEPEEAEVPPEVHLIGQRVEPALEMLDVYLDQALRASKKEVRVVHGHGSGKLRDAVRQHLRGHRAIASMRAGAPNEGGNGATVVVFRE